MLLHEFIQSLATNILHHDPVFLFGILFHVEDRDQVRMFQIQALRNTAQFHFEIIVQQLQRDFFAGIAERVINFAESTSVNCSLDGVTIERFGFRSKSEPHKIVPTQTKLKDSRTVSQHGTETLRRTQSHRRSELRNPSPVLHSHSSPFWIDT